MTDTDQLRRSLHLAEQDSGQRRDEVRRLRFALATAANRLEQAGDKIGAQRARMELTRPMEG